MSRSERSRRHPGKKRANRSAPIRPQNDERTSVEQADASEQQEKLMERFEARCHCGAVLRGERSPGETTALCPSCGTELALAPVVAAPLAPPMTDETSIGATNDSAAVPRTQNATSENASSKDPIDAVASAEVHPERLEQRRHWNWLRLGAAAVLVLVAATVYWGWQQRRRQQDLLELQSALAEGQAALDKAEFDRAVDRLAIADRAAARLGATSGPGLHARQLYREALIWSNLPVTSIDDFFFSHANEAVDKSTGPLVAAFDKSLAGRSIIIQGRAVLRTDVIAAPQAFPEDKAPDNAAGQPAPVRPIVVLDWAIVGDGFRAEISGVDLAALANAADQEVIFGAMLRSVDRDPRRPRKWLVRLVPESVALLTASGPFERISWPDRGAVQAILDQQRDRVLANSSDAVVPQGEDAAR